MSREILASRISPDFVAARQQPLSNKEEPMKAWTAPLTAVAKGFLIGFLLTSFAVREATGAVMNPAVAATIMEARSRPDVSIDDLIERLEPLEAPAVAALRIALLDEDPFVRQTAVAILGRVGDPCSRLMCRLLKDEVEPVRAAAEQALIELGPPAVACLGETLLTESPSSDAKVRAARALGRIGEPEGVPFLIETLRKFQRGGFRTDVVCASLARIGQPAARALIEQLRFPSLREDVYGALLLIQPAVVRAELLALARDAARAPEERAVYATEGEQILGSRALAGDLLPIYTDLQRALGRVRSRREGPEVAELVARRSYVLRNRQEAEYLPLTSERVRSSFAAAREAEYRREMAEDARRRQERQSRLSAKDLAIKVAPEPKQPSADAAALKKFEPTPPSPSKEERKRGEEQLQWERKQQEINLRKMAERQY